MVDAHSATAADFDRAAQRNANAFWRWLVATGVCWWVAPSWWWAVVPGLLCLWNASNSIGATLAGRSLRKGTYRVYNPNNGAPDGDAANWSGAGQSDVP